MKPFDFAELMFYITSGAYTLQKVLDTFDFKNTPIGKPPTRGSVETMSTKSVQVVDILTIYADDHRMTTHILQTNGVNEHQNLAEELDFNENILYITPVVS